MTVESKDKIKPWPNIRALLDATETISEEELTEILKALNCSREDYEACKEYLKQSKGW